MSVIFDLILDQFTKYHGWRFYLPLIVTAVIATVVHFTIGWTDASISITIVLTLVSTLSGILWQYLHERTN